MFLRVLCWLVWIDWYCCICGLFCVSYAVGFAVLLVYLVCCLLYCLTPWIWVGVYWLLLVCVYNVCCLLCCGLLLGLYGCMLIILLDSLFWCLFGLCVCCCVVGVWLPLLVCWLFLWWVLIALGISLIVVTCFGLVVDCVYSLVRIACGMFVW